MLAHFDLTPWDLALLAALLSSPVWLALIVCWLIDLIFGKPKKKQRRGFEVKLMEKSEAEDAARKR